MIWPVERVSLMVDPAQEFNRLYREMNRLFGEYCGGGSYPPVNLWSDDNEAVVSAHLPGIDPKDVNIAVENDVLVIEGERKAETPGESDVQVRRERPMGRFSRKLQLPFEIESETVAARYENGLLNIRLPRREATKPRKIQIAVG